MDINFLIYNEFIESKLKSIDQFILNLILTKITTKKLTYIIHTSCKLN